MTFHKSVGGGGRRNPVQFCSLSTLAGFSQHSLSGSTLFSHPTANLSDEFSSLNSVDLFYSAKVILPPRHRGEFLNFIT